MNDKTRDFIEQNLNADIRQLALKGCRDKDVDLDAAIRQIAGRQTARRKLPSWAALDGILYPPHLNMEQCSSEQTARYKARICSSHPSPKTLVDLTGGFGVDFDFMSEAFDEATYVERNSELFAISSANMKILAPKAKCLNEDGLEVLHRLDHVSMIFMDPARRDHHGARTYGISDCTPNVLEIKDELLQKADVVMLKLSPMLDWHKAISDLGEQYIKEVHIVSVQNECKELLIIMQQQPAKPFTVYCVNDDAVFSYHPSSLIPHPSSFIPHPSSFLYEPNASIMKAGCFAEIEQAFEVSQLAPNSHLFASDQVIEDFPGRKFRVTAVTSMNKQELKQALRDIRQANISVRNFPMSVADLRKRLKLSEGGNDYIFATTLTEGKKVLIICQHL
ncbi:SAM-dependent methyltransferase [Prevotella communis]|uniref:THUMP-like domain-containing protein n=1 Tax=Prevotella communis TaxID=2913614 RepID=UPI001EDAB666|nr:SAM-dependent methyltransferase [Prevotella communis]UKK62119.1 SAM-dependent methyltransferase [Prevotella communis]UKK64946.1 SAM-dependent methyltransferase [Prevotella communis]UKK70539.1 SAM-dependent methyltransferase [Prevotella communis]